MLLEAGREPRVADRVGLALDLDRGSEVRAPEHDAGVRRSRAQGQIDLGPGVQAHARGPDHVFQGTLLNHDNFLNFQVFRGNILSRALAAVQKKCNETRLCRELAAVSFQWAAKEKAARPAAGRAKGESAGGCRLTAGGWRL